MSFSIWACCIIISYVTGCIDTFFAGPPKYNDAALLDVVREKYLIPPPTNPDTPHFDTSEPPWARLMDWNQVQDFLKMIWEGQVGSTTNVMVR